MSGNNERNEVGRTELEKFSATNINGYFFVAINCCL